MSKTCELIAKGCLYHIVIVRDLESEVPSIESVTIVTKFLEVFLYDLLKIPPEWDIRFRIDLLQDTQPMSIPSYRITPAEWKVINA